MKFDYISDLHIEFIFNSKEPREKTVKAWFNDIFETKQSNTLIVAGDIAESIEHTLTFFKLVSTIYNYEHIVWVFGNHDFWITNNSQKKKYKTSYNKITLAKQLCTKFNETSQNKIHLLDGNTIEINGIKIGGAMGWYDTSYFYKYRSMYSTINPYDLWKTQMNDYRFIIPRCSEYLDITTTELAKVKSVLTENPDIVVTHICPISNDLCTDERYKGNLTNSFYTFDGQDLIEQHQPKFWIYGHMHGTKQSEIFNTILLRNAHGYPSEYFANMITIKTLEI